MIRALIHSFLVAAWGASLLWPQPRADTSIPKTWDETALAGWATPLAGLNVRPTHISSQEYYSMRVDNLRTYPVYFPGREPEGYWEMLQHVGPQPLIEPVFGANVRKSVLFPVSPNVFDRIQFRRIAGEVFYPQ